MISTPGSEDVSLLGESPAIVALRREIRKAARTSAKVLILGETGVGKEVVARLIHRGGPRQDRQLVAVNCSGIPETLLESELLATYVAASPARTVTSPDWFTKPRVARCFWTNSAR